MGSMMGDRFIQDDDISLRGRELASNLRATNFRRDAATAFGNPYSLDQDPGIAQGRLPCVDESRITIGDDRNEKLGKGGHWKAPADLRKDSGAVAFRMPGRGHAGHRPHEILVRPAGFEPAACRLGGDRSIHLSYGR